MGNIGISNKNLFKVSYAEPLYRDPLTPRPRYMSEEIGDLSCPDNIKNDLILRLAGMLKEKAQVFTRANYEFGGKVHEISLYVFTHEEIEQLIKEVEELTLKYRKYEHP